MTHSNRGKGKGCTDVVFSVQSLAIVATFYAENDADFEPVKSKVISNALDDFAELLTANGRAKTLTLEQSVEALASLGFTKLHKRNRGRRKFIYDLSLEALNDEDIPQLKRSAEIEKLF